MTIELRYDLDYHDVAGFYEDFEIFYTYLDENYQIQNVRQGWSNTHSGPENLFITRTIKVPKNSAIFIDAPCSQYIEIDGQKDDSMTYYSWAGEGDKGYYISVIEDGMHIIIE